jgi:predicted RNase H-like HicB family nuclease
MKYKVVFIESDEGFAASCPALRGCHSQGRTRKEATENIRQAIREWLVAEKDEQASFRVIEDEVEVTV